MKVAETIRQIVMQLDALQKEVERRDKYIAGLHEQIYSVQKLAVKAASLNSSGGDAADVVRECLRLQYLPGFGK